MVFYVNIVNSASREPFMSYWKSVQYILYHSFVDDQVHAFFVLASSDLSCSLVVQELYLSVHYKN